MKEIEEEFIKHYSELITGAQTRISKLEEEFKYIQEHIQQLPVGAFLEFEVDDTWYRFRILHRYEIVGDGILHTTQTRKTHSKIYKDDSRRKTSFTMETFKDIQDKMGEYMYNNCTPRPQDRRYFCPSFPSILQAFLERKRYWISEK